MNPEPTDSQPKAKPLVLIMDDDVPLAEAIRDELIEIGAECRVCVTSNEAVQFLLENRQSGRPIELAILDMWVPRNLGEPQDTKAGFLAFLTGLRAWLFPANCPVIIFTGHPDIDQCIDCVKAGATYYLAKVELNRSNSDRLLDYCRRILFPTAEDDPLALWLREHKAEVLATYPNQVVGLFNLAAAQAAGLSGKIIGQQLAVGAASTEALGQMMLENKILRWEEPRMIDLRYQ